MKIALLNKGKYNRFAIFNNTPLEKERRTINKTNIKCPRCNSDKLYKFGLKKQIKQKYQCRQYKRQFVLGDGDGLTKRIILGAINLAKKPTYIIYINIYNRYKFNNKKCNYIIVKHHTTNIDTAYSK